LDFEPSVANKYTDRLKPKVHNLREAEGAAGVSADAEFCALLLPTIPIFSTLRANPELRIFRKFMIDAIRQPSDDKLRVLAIARKRPLKLASERFGPHPLE
jgi:hypothetical protein